MKMGIGCGEKNERTFVYGENPADQFLKVR